MIKRRAIGPDQIQEGNKIECHVAGACATYLDSNLEWQISDNTVRQHFPSPSDATTGREIWTNRPLTVGINTHGKRQDLVTIRESSSLGKHTEWTITPIDPYSLRRKSQPVDTEYDLDEQVIQATSNNTTRIFTPYTGQTRISYEITAPPGGEIREENGRINAYRDDFYLFTIADPTIYDADKHLITDAEDLPVRCYDLRVADMGRDAAGRRLYAVTKVRCCDAPEECAFVDVEITSKSGLDIYSIAKQIANWAAGTLYSVPYVTEEASQKHLHVGVRPISGRFPLWRTFFEFDLSGVSGVVVAANIAVQIYSKSFTGTLDLTARSGTVRPSTMPTNIAGGWASLTDTVKGELGITSASPSSVTIPLEGDFSGLPGESNYVIGLSEKNYIDNYNPLAPPSGNTYLDVVASTSIGDLPVLELIIDPGHTGTNKKAEIVGSIPTGGGVVQLDLAGAPDTTVQAIAAALADTTGATDLHLRQVNPDGTPGALIPFQRLGVTNPGTPAAFTYSCKANFPAGVTDFCWCYGDPDYVDFSSTVSGDPENPTETESGDGYWSFLHGVTVNVTDSSGPLSGATVTFDGVAQTTGGTGSVTFADIPAAAGYVLNVAKDGYVTYECTVNVTDADVTQNIELTLNTATVIFSITEALMSHPLEGVSVVFCTAPEQFTNSSGEATFPGVALVADRPYTLSKAGFVTQTGTINVTGNATFPFVMQYAVPAPLPDPGVPDLEDPRTVDVDVTGVSQYLAEQYRS